MGCSQAISQVPLWVGTFDVYTENNLLIYVLTIAKLDAASHCWVANLANYNFQLYYRAGKPNIKVDAMSSVLAGMHA